MAEMSTDVATTTTPRRSLSSRQRSTVDALLEAGRSCLLERTIHDLSLRDIARAADVTHTTAYTYFASKEHVIAELHRRLLLATSVPDPDPSASIGQRIETVLAPTPEVFADEPHLAEAVAAAMASADPDIRRIRDEVGAEIARRIAAAVGPDADREIVDGLMLCYAGAMSQAGLGYTSFAGGIHRIAAFADRWPNAR